MKGKQNPPPSGPIIIPGMITSAEHVIEGGKLYIQVLTRDPYSGNLKTLSNIEVRQFSNEIVTGISDDQQFDVYIPSYENYLANLTTGVFAVPNAESHVVQNESIPLPVKSKDYIGSMSNMVFNVCRDMNHAREQSDKHAGILTKRDDIVVLQGKKNGKSPGVLVHQQDGSLYMFDATSKQYIAIDTENTKVRTNSLDIGTAKMERSTLAYAGLPQYENDMNDVMPQGTIVTPLPKTLPHIMRVLNTASNIASLMDFVDNCKTAVDELLKLKSSDISQVREDRKKEIRDRAIAQAWEAQQEEENV